MNIESQSGLDLVLFNSKNSNILKEACQPWDFENSEIDPLEFSQALVKKMHDHNGIGLAANQVGLPFRVFAMRGTPNFVCFNPRITATGSEQVVLEEACLSYPGLVVKVKRPSTIRVRFQTPNGETRTERFGGLSARCFQHELMHLDGEIFYKDASPLHRTPALRRWKIFQRHHRIAA